MSGSDCRTTQNDGESVKTRLLVTSTRRTMVSCTERQFRNEVAPSMVIFHLGARDEY
jgi:hypothetical protein